MSIGPLSEFMLSQCSARWIIEMPIVQQESVSCPNVPSIFVESYFVTHGDPERISTTKSIDVANISSFLPVPINVYFFGL